MNVGPNAVAVTSRTTRIRALAGFLASALLPLLAGTEGPAEPSASGDSSGATTPITAATVGPLAATEQEDRALREEQLRAARQLAADLPGSDDALYVLGLVYNEQGDTTSAIRSWEEALQTASDAVEVHGRAETCYGLGYALLLREDYPKAITLLREARELSPRNGDIAYRLAHALYLAGNMEECLQALDQGAVESALAYRLRGQANQQLNRLVEAKQAYSTAVQLNPKLAEAYYGLAMTCARLGEETAAEEYRQKFDALKTQGQAMGRQARTDFNPLAITRRNLALTHSEVGRVYAAHGRADMAEKLYLRAAQVDPSDTASRFQLVMLYQKAQRNDEALKIAQEMVQAEPRNGLHHLAVGNLRLRLKQVSAAEAAFRQVTNLAPQRPEGYFALAQVYLQTNTNQPQARLLAEKAVQLAPTPPNYYVLSQACAAVGDWPGAKSAIDKACALDPRNPQYLEWRSRLAGRVGSADAQGPTRP